jgi:PAS domain S-box-containing protein
MSNTPDRHRLRSMLRSGVTSTVASFIPPAIQSSDPNRLRRAQVVVTFGFPLILIGLIYLAVFTWMDSLANAAAITPAIAVAFLALLVLRWTGSLVIAGNLLATALFAVLTALTCRLGGHGAVTLWWYVAVPIVALSAAGRRSAIVWLGITALSLSVFYVLDRSGYTFPNDLTPDQYNLLHLLGTIGLVGLMLTFGCLYEVFKDCVTSRLQASEQRFRDLALSTSHRIWEVDADGKYTFAAGNVEGVLGYTPEELMGRTLFDLMPPEEAKNIAEAFATIASNRENIEDLVNWNLHKDGRAVCLLTNGVPILGDDGRLLGYRGVDKDITDRKRAEAVFEAERKQLVTMFDGMDEVVYVSDPQTYEILYMNQRAKDNWGDRVGDQCYRALQNLDSPCPFCTNDRIFGENAGQPHIWEFQNQVNQRWFHCIDRAIQWPDGRAVRLELAIDITDRKQAEAALRQAKETAESANTALEAKVRELEAFNRLAVGREMRMIELKQEINELLAAQGRESEYEVVDAEVTT